MLYISQALTKLRQKAMMIQEEKIKQMTEKQIFYDFEQNLIAKTKKS
jgi:hypothetical protein